MPTDLIYEIQRMSPETHGLTMPRERFADLLLGVFRRDYRHLGDSFSDLLVRPREALRYCDRARDALAVAGEDATTVLDVPDDAILRHLYYWSAHLGGPPGGRPTFIAGTPATEDPPAADDPPLPPRPVPLLPDHAGPGVPFAARSLAEVDGGQDGVLPGGSVGNARGVEVSEAEADQEGGGLSELDAW